MQEYPHRLSLQIITAKLPFCWDMGQRLVLAANHSILLPKSASLQLVLLRSKELLTASSIPYDICYGIEFLITINYG
jgi:hypothetical protein